MISLQIAKRAVSLCQRDEIGIHGGFKIGCVYILYRVLSF